MKRKIIFFGQTHLAVKYAQENEGVAVLSMRGDHKSEFIVNLAKFREGGFTGLACDTSAVSGWYVSGDNIQVLLDDSFPAKDKAARAQALARLRVTTPSGD